MDPGPEQENRPARLMTAVAWSLTLLAATSLVLQVARTEIVDANDGCGWDGGQYCLMANGQWSVIPPFGRRVLVPWLVGLLDVDRTVDGFRLVNALALILAAVALVVLARRLGARTRTHAVVVLALFVLNPWTVRIWFSYPALTDHASLALLLVWLVLVLRRDAWAAWLSVLVLVAMVLTREQWAVVGIPFVWFAVVLGFKRARWGAVSTVTGGAAALFVFSRPSSIEPSTLSSLLGVWWTDVSAGPDNAARFLFQALCGLTFLSVLVAVRARVLVADRALLFVTALAAATLAVTVTGGGDVDRILSPVGVLAGLVALVLTVRDDRLTIPFAFLAVATICLWHPFHTISSDPARWLDFYALRSVDIGTAVARIQADGAAAAAPVLIASMSLWSVLRGRRSDEPRRTERGTAGWVNPCRLPSARARESLGHHAGPAPATSRQRRSLRVRWSVSRTLV